jgi:16S rRNA (uracil1498-N3)-methyltransferase
VSRRYLVRPLPPPGPHTLPAEVAHHLNVVRARPGDRVRLFDGAGTEAWAELVDVGRRRVDAIVEAHAAVEREPVARVELACAVPKGARSEWLFEHGTEVGVAAFRPLRFARSNPSRRERQDRFERIVAAAAEQCDRSRLPEVHEESSLEALLADPALPGERYVAAPGAPAALGPARSRAAILVVGPEGGLTQEEVEALAAAGFRPVDLGPLILRTETAALVGAARLLTPPDQAPTPPAPDTSSDEANGRSTPSANDQ